MGAGGGMASLLPPPSANLIGWWKSDTEVFTDTGFTTPATASNDAVKGWKDQSGAGNHLTEATNAPTLQLAQVNGKPSVRFDGVNDKLAAAFTLDRPFTYFLVVKQITFTGNDHYVSGYSGDNFALTQDWSGGTPYIALWNGSTNTRPNGDLSVGAWGLIQAYCSNASPYSTMKVNAGSYDPSSGGSAASLARGGVTVAAHPSGTAFGNVEFAEILLYNVHVDETNCGLVRTYISGKYGIF